MPIYEYICRTCACQFELLRSINSAGEGASCPRCNNAADRKLSTFAAFSKSSDGFSAPVASAGGNCSSCSSSSCSTC